MRSIRASQSEEPDQFEVHVTRDSSGLGQAVLPRIAATRTPG